MKQNKMNIKQERSIREWEELVERYFDALTTDAEEQQLRSFLLSSEAVGEVFDEAKAVMGFLEAGRTMHQEKKGHRMMHYWKVAAMVAVVMGSAALWNAWDRMQNVCEAYIYGKKCTEVAMVMSQVQHSLDKVNYPEEEDIVETQLSDFFQMMEEE